MKLKLMSDIFSQYGIIYGLQRKSLKFFRVLGRRNKAQGLRCACVEWRRNHKYCSAFQLSVKSNSSFLWFCFAMLPVSEIG